MKHVLAILFASLMVALPARAGDGFVVEAENARPNVGTRVDDASQLSVAAGGHLVVMTSTGEMIRHDGPFDGSAAELFRKVAGGGAPLSGGLLDSLLELAEDSGKSEDELGAVRGAARDAAAPADSISNATATYCLAKGQRPVFHVAEAPAGDEQLLVRRRVRPKQMLRTTWPAGRIELQWPADWPEPLDGRYLWSLGGFDASGVRMVLVDDVPAAPLARAARYNDLGCAGQARALFRRELARAAR